MGAATVVVRVYCVGDPTGRAWPVHGSDPEREGQSVSEHLPNTETDGSAQLGPPAEPTLAQELTGSLRCAVCRYDLRGLTIKGRCPECGLAIQATLLSLVDPRAAEIQPIRAPRIVAAGLVAWSVGALAAVVLGCAFWMTTALDVQLGVTTRHRMVVAGAIGLSISAVGALVILRPHAGIPLRRTLAAAMGVALYPIAVKLYLGLGVLTPTGLEGSILDAFSGELDATPWRRTRLLMWLVLAVGAWGLRGNLRFLAARSLIVRAERVDRQTIAGAVAALGIAALGDLLGLLAPSLGDWGGSVVLVAEVLVGLGAMLLTLAMVGILADTLRMLPAILQRPLGLHDVLSNGDHP